MAEVEETSSGGKEVEGGLGVAAGALEDSAALAGPFLSLLEMKKKGEPDGEVVVAQAAGTLFEIGLQVKDGVAVFGVAGAGDFAELLGYGVPLAEDEAREDGLVKLLIEGELAGEETAVEGGQGEFEVVGVEAAGFLHGAGTGAGAKADVPHALDNDANRFPGLFFGLFVGEGEEYIDVGVGEEIFAAVAAESEQGDVLRGLPGKGPAPHFNEDAVDHGGAAADGCRAIAGALTGLADKRHLPRILLPKIVNRKSDWIHEDDLRGLPKQVRIFNRISDVGREREFLVTEECSDRAVIPEHRGSGEKACLCSVIPFTDEEPLFAHAEDVADMPVWRPSANADRFDDDFSALRRDLDHLRNAWCG